MGLFPIKIEQIFRVLKTCGYLSSMWPAQVTASKREIYFRDVIWFIAIFNYVGFLIPFALRIARFDYDVLNMMSAISRFMSLAEVLLNLILCRILKTRLQKLQATIQDFMKHSEQHERHVIQKYINRYSKLFVFVLIQVSITMNIFSFGPFFLSNFETPIEGVFPFSLDNPYIKSVIYITQVYTIYQAGIHITVDITIAMFFGYCTARLEMLGLELQQIRYESQIKACILKHQEIISFVGEVQDTIQYLIFKSNITMGSSVIAGAFPLVYNPPFTVMLQFICLILASCQRLYITAWPADDLSRTSQEIAWYVYKMPWFEKSHDIATSVFLIIQRSNKPLAISIGGILPVLSLEYYINFLKLISSYFMTIRAAINA